jgi:hypothetical protein
MKLSLFQLRSILANEGGPEYCSRYSDLLRAGRSRDRIPVGVRFSASVQTGPGPTSLLYNWNQVFPGG